MFRVYSVASTANLGPGLNILGLALELYNVFQIEENNEFELINFQERYNHQNNLFLKGYRQVFEFTKKELIPIKCTLEVSNIPISKGLGSSTSLIVAGLLAANHILNNPLNKFELLKIATKLEGYPNNAAPCIFGGLCASQTINEELFFKQYPIHPDIKTALIIPNFILEANKKKACLPLIVDHKHGINNMANLLMILEGLKTNDEKLIKHGIIDHLHVPFRKNLIDEYDKVNKILKKHEPLAITISGTGPSLLCLFNKEYSLEAIQNDLSSLENDWQVLPLAINNEGSVVHE